MGDREWAHGDACDKDGGTAGWLTVDVLGEVANSQVDRIRGLVAAEGGNLGLVGSEYDRRDGGPVVTLLTFA